MITYNAHVWQFLKEQDYLDERDVQRVLAMVKEFRHNTLEQPKQPSPMYQDLVKTLFLLADPEAISAMLINEFKIGKGLDTLKEA